MGAHIFRRGDALQRGVADHQLQRLCRNGTWQRIRPGRYADRAEFDELDAYTQHRIRAEESLLAASPDAVLSHQSAAVVHGLNLWNTPLKRTHLTRNRSTGGSRTPHRHVHSVPLDPDEITEVDGLRVTTVARTVADLARTLSFEQAVVVGDHALHSLSLASTDLEAAAARLPPHAGRRRVLRLVTQLDGRSESVGESRSRVLMIRTQLPVPDCQAVLHSDDGRHLGRVDFLFEELGIVGEFDGRVKYGSLVPEGQTAADVLWQEKRREDAIRGAGWQMVRWGWDELATPDAVVRRIRDAEARAQRCPPPSGRVEHTARP